jgi:hypothetical protein
MTVLKIQIDSWSFSERPIALLAMSVNMKHLKALQISEGLNNNNITYLYDLSCGFFLSSEGRHIFCATQEELR